MALNKLAYYSRRYRNHRNLMENRTFEGTTKNELARDKAEYDKYAPLSNTVTGLGGAAGFWAALKGAKAMKLGGGWGTALGIGLTALGALGARYFTDKATGRHVLRSRIDKNTDLLDKHRTVEAERSKFFHDPTSNGYYNYI